MDEKGRDDLLGGKQKASSLAQVQKLADIGLMTSALLHEIKQPLLGIKGYAQLLTARGGEEASLILKQVERIEQLIGTHRKLLYTGEQARVPKDLVGIVREALEVVAPRAKSLGAEVVLNLSPKPLPVTVVEGQILQVLTNLLGNALDALEKSGKSKLQVVTRTDGTTVDLLIADDGPGLDASAVANLYAPFFTTKGPEKGTGLGLYISKTLAEGNGATLEHLPSLVVGLEAKTVFRLRFRASAEARPAARRVLVVDDEEVVRSLLVDLLKPEGLEIEICETGDAAVRLLEAKTFDLVITDKNLPGANGLEVARAAQKRSPTPVILMTGYPSLETAQEGLDAGLIDYLEKPFDDIGAVRKRVRDALAPKKAPASPPVKSGTRRVLIIDDRAEDAMQIAEAVSMAGGLPTIVTTLTEALTRLGGEGISGAILSLDLKDRALTPENIRKLKNGAHGPLVTLCAQPTLEQTVSAIRMGAAACLPRALASPQVLAKELKRLFALPDRAA